MTFKDWIFSNRPSDNQTIAGQWGWLHITTLLVCIATIITLALVFRKRSEKARKIVIWILVGIIFVFEMSRRSINLIKTTDYSAHNLLHTLLPRPWCAIACWSLIASVLVNKKFFYNFASTTALLCAIIYFAYPGTGFNDKYIVFENVYSITTHGMLLITSITLITLKFTKFEYKNIWKELICLGFVFLYAILEIFVLKIEADPLYFMPGGDIQDIFGVQWGVYLTIYIIFVVIYLNMFYLIDDRKNVFKKRKKTAK